MPTLNLKPVEFDALSAKKQASFEWAGRILLPKYDGCFAMVGFLDGEPHAIWSRTGEVVQSMGHIYEDLLLRYPWITTHEGGLMLLGEAWLPGKDFAELSGMFRRQYPQPLLGFAAFDVVHYHMNNGVPLLRSHLAYKARVAQLQDTRHVTCNVFPPLPVVCENREHAERYARYLKELGGYDGAICSDPHADYKPGSGKDGEFIKVKPLISYSLECIGYEAATGEKTGRATGALIVRFKDDKPLKVATGLSEEQQADLGQFVGKVIEVEAMGASSKGLLREPRFKGVRYDAKPEF